MSVCSLVVCPCSYNFLYSEIEDSMIGICNDNFNNFSNNYTQFANLTFKHPEHLRAVVQAPVVSVYGRSSATGHVPQNHAAAVVLPFRSEQTRRFQRLLLGPPSVRLRLVLPQTTL